MSFFKRKIAKDVIPADFKTLEVHFNGETYGMVLGCFRKGDKGEIIPIDSDELPKMMIDMHIDSVIKEVKSDMDKLLLKTQFDINTALSNFRDVLHDAKDRMDKAIENIQ